MTIYNADSKTTTNVIVPCCFMREGGWPARHLWKFTHDGKVCERCGAKIVLTMPEGYDADKPPKSPPRTD